jgi:predicted amidohydrolase
LLSYEDCKDRCKVHLLSSEQIFDAGSDSHVFQVDGLRFGVNICDDTNLPEAARKIADLGASLIVCPANNMHLRMRRRHSRTCTIPCGVNDAVKQGFGSFQPM